MLLTEISIFYVTSGFLKLPVETRHLIKRCSYILTIYNFERKRQLMLPIISYLLDWLFRQNSRHQVSVQFGHSLTLCDSMDCSIPGLPVHHQILELAQNHAHQVSDAIQPSHPWSSPFLPSIFPSKMVLPNESVIRIRWTKYWSFNFNISPSNEYSTLISFRMDWLDLFAVQGTLKSLLQHHSSKALSFLYGPALTSIHNYWKKHSFD